jgi:hypothetical protein
VHDCLKRCLYDIQALISVEDVLQNKDGVLVLRLNEMRQMRFENREVVLISLTQGTKSRRIS